MKRRHFIRATGLSLAATLLYDNVFSATGERITTIALPNRVSAIVDNQRVEFSKAGDLWIYQDVAVNFETTKGVLAVFIQAPDVLLSEVTLTWETPRSGTTVLNDQWERTYGDASWHQPKEGERFPWYFMEHSSAGTSGMGVKTNASSFCAWAIDNGQLSLTLDTRSGGNGVKLGNRKLKAAELVSITSKGDEAPFHTARRFMKLMCNKPRMPKQPVYGINDWYFSYGNNSARLIMEHTRLIAPAAAGLKNRPFSMIDDGWFKTSPCGPEGKWTWGDDMITPNTNFPDMKQLADDIRKEGMRPGLWIRPLSIKAGTKETLLLPDSNTRRSDMPVLDPSIPENLETIKNYFKVYHQWGYEMVKFDYTSWDIFGKWGMHMTRDNAMTQSGWSMYDTSKTNAEIISGMYSAIREAAGDIYVIGCNTFSHLSAGLFELNRIGDDTSGNEWDRTRKMGVNTLAFRGIHHGAFYAADADCVGLTTKVPWEKTVKWLELVAKSGTPLFISAQPEATKEAQLKSITACFKLASQELPLGEPLDWLESHIPTRWKLNGKVEMFDWD
ncbi:MAG: alpha-galactosidase [Cyclobacteriaceae bacterium]|nr:alpha-galactosidase [Cyclobacteriaceae bacterium]